MTASVYVNVFLGQTRAAGWIRTLESYGFGEMCCRGELPPRRNPWAFDNGAFKDWDKKGPMPRAAFNAAKYQKELDYLHLHCTTRPEFMVVPDLPANGAESLAFSLEWLERLPKQSIPLYLVVQDGMETAAVSDVLQKFDGIFVGGSLPWKLKTGRDWVRFAHNSAIPCHLGRFGTESRVRAAIRWGADSIDSCLPLWGEANLRRFLRGFNPELTGQLFPEVA